MQMYACVYVCAFICGERESVCVCIYIYICDIQPDTVYLEIRDTHIPCDLCILQTNIHVLPNLHMHTYTKIHTLVRKDAYGS